MHKVALDGFKSHEEWKQLRNDKKYQAARQEKIKRRQQIALNEELKKQQQNINPNMREQDKIAMEKN